MTIITESSPQACFVGGTLVLEDADRSVAPPAPFQWVNARWRCPAVHYRAIRAWLNEHGIRTVVPRRSDVPLVLHDDCEPHTYQAEAINGWLAADCFAYHIARRHLIPVITHQTTAAERKAILDDFRSGKYRAIVTSKVLNEGVDVPEAKVAVVLGGSSSAREYVQRLGRVLRKKGNEQAVLYEVIVRNTVDEGIAQRRKPRTVKVYQEERHEP